jgi:WD40 repeat protein
LTLWEVQTGRHFADLGPSGSTIYSVAFAPDGQSVSAVVGNVLKTWDTANGAETASRTLAFMNQLRRRGKWSVQHDGRGNFVAVEEVFTFMKEGYLRRWDVRAEDELPEGDLPEGTDALFPSINGVLRYRQPSDFFLFDRVRATRFPQADDWFSPGAWNGMSYAPGANVFARVVRSIYNDRVEIKDGLTVRTLDLPTGAVRPSVLLAPDGRRVAVSLAPLGSVQTTGARLSLPPSVSERWLSWLRSIVGLQDSSSNTGEELRVYDVASGKVQARFPDGVAGYFSPDGKSLAVVYADRVAIYDLPFRASLLLLAGIGLGAAAVANLLTGVRLGRRSTRLTVSVPGTAGVSGGDPPRTDGDRNAGGDEHPRAS